tara:strand:+ start:16209 stop:17201 length:993 start_codon:yes stop_codon:yes gene_type:complete
MKILVTGSEGFIGSHLTEELLRQGHQVRAFVLYNSFNSWGWLEDLPENLKINLEVFMGDIRDPNGVREAAAGCESIIHLAALIAIPFSYHSPDSYIDTNIKGTLNIIQAAKELDIKVIHTSTSEVYGSADYIPINEEHPLKGQSPYSASKIGADQIAMSFYNSFDTKVSIIRPFNTFGPRQSARAVIPTIITQILNGKREINLGSLHPTRDFTYVDDTVSGFVCALNNDSGIGKVINLGSGFEISIGDTVKKISQLCGADIDVVSDSSRRRPEKSEVDRLFADNTKAKTLLDWTPSSSSEAGFDAGLEKTIEWLSVKENLRKYKSDIYNI